MKDKIVVFLTVLSVILIFILILTRYQNKSLKMEKNALQIEVIKKDKAIQEMEKQNHVLREAEKENSKFREQLAQDKSDNLDVVPEPYILERLRKD